MHNTIARTLTAPFALILLSAALLLQGTSLRAAVIIQYHHVDDNTPPITSVTVKQFTEHMQYLANNDFNVWPLPKIIRALKDEQALPDKVIAITFDDGYKSVLENAVPLLRKHRFPYTVFVNTDLIGHSQEFMSWKQLQQLNSEGATIANHTATHSHLVRQRDDENYFQWRKRIEEEIMQAENNIRHQLGESPGMLAYPYGEYNNLIKLIVKTHELIGFAQHSGAFDRRVDWQAVPRFAFNQTYAEMQDFADKVNSLPMPLLNAIARDHRGEPLEEPLIPPHSHRPTLKLTLQSAELANRVQCFASGQGRVPAEVDNATVTLQLQQDLPVGRSRINCTAASEQAGRFYWYSHFFMRKTESNEWYDEP
jgi:peptidoglycan/xylan/chitin deacetylase (PgdA/CDA1 family)